MKAAIQRCIDAIRKDPLVGKGSCSTVDECLDDDDVVTRILDDFDLGLIEDPTVAVRKARDFEEGQLERALDARWGEDDDPQLAYREWKAAREQDEATGTAARVTEDQPTDEGARTMTTTATKKPKTDNRGTCTGCNKKGARLNADGRCTKCRDDKGKAAVQDSSPQFVDGVLLLDTGSETIDVGNKKVRGYSYRHDKTTLLHTLSYPAGVVAHKPVTPATYTLPKGAQLVARTVYELVVDGRVIKGLGALVEAGTVQVVLHEEERTTPPAKPKAEPQAGAK